MKIFINLSKTSCSFLNFKAVNQQGFATLTLIMILLTLGLGLLIGFTIIIHRWQNILMSENHNYQRFNQTISALNWATTQNWLPPDYTWQCKKEDYWQYSVCIRFYNPPYLKQTDQQYLIIKSDYQGYFLYRLALFNNGKLHSHAQHWLDFCPEKRTQCE